MATKLLEVILLRQKHCRACWLSTARSLCKGWCIIILLHECRREPGEFWSLFLAIILPVIVNHCFSFSLHPSIIFSYHSIIHYSFFLRFTSYPSLCSHFYFQKLFHLRWVTDWWTFPIIKCPILTYLFLLQTWDFMLARFFMNMCLVVVYFLAKAGTHTTTSVIVRQHNLTDCRCGSAPAHTHTLRLV